MVGCVELLDVELHVSFHFRADFWYLTPLFHPLANAWAQAGLPEEVTNFCWVEQPNLTCAMLAHSDSFKAPHPRTHPRRS